MTKSRTGNTSEQVSPLLSSKPKSQSQTEKERATWIAKDYIEKILKLAAQFILDPSKEARQEDNFCKYCWYGPPVFSGQAFTEASCRECGKNQMFSTTHTHALCPDCAKKTKRCVVCGADRELKQKTTTK